MNGYHDYESLGMVDFRRIDPEPLPETRTRLNRDRVGLVEAFSGTAIVEWWHKIYDQLIKHEQEADKARNFAYVDKIRKFRQVWENNKLDGSINVEPLNALYSAASVLGADTWNLASYFRTLATKLDVVIQSENQLPRGMDMNQNEPFAGTGGAGRGAPPMAPSFGPDEEPPPGMEGGEGGPGGGGGGGGAIPGEPGAPGGEPYPEGGVPGEGANAAGNAPGPEDTMPPEAQAEQPGQAGALGGEAEPPEPGEEEQFSRM